MNTDWRFVFVSLFAASALTACGSDNSNNQPVYPVNSLASCQGSCPTPDLVQTTVGCLPQAGCATCSGSENGSCVPGVAGVQSGYTGQYGAAVPGVGVYPYGTGPYGEFPPDDEHHHHDHDHGW